MADTRTVFDRHPVITGAAIACVILLVLDLVAGTAMRHLGHSKTLERHAREAVFRIRNERYDHDFAPMKVQDSAYWGPIRYPMRTNSLGFRDASARTITFDEATRDVLLIGDSFTEGVGVEFDSTFAGRLAHLADGHGVRVLNAGVSSYAPTVYWRKVVDVVARRNVPVKEVVVFVDAGDIVDEINYYVDADTSVHMHMKFGSLEYENPNPADPLGVRVRAWWRLHSLVVFKGIRSVLYAIINPCGKPGAYDDVRCKEGLKGLSFMMSGSGARGLRLATDHMSALAAFLRERRIPLTVVIYPWRHQLDEHDPAPAYTAAWSTWSAREGVPLVNLFPSFFEGADARGLRAMTDEITIPGDVHWNARGHDFVTTAFARAYCASALTPARPLHVICPGQPSTSPAR